MRSKCFNWLTKTTVFLIIAGGFFFGTIKVRAQQEILTTQWADNKLTVNPGYTGRGTGLLSACFIRI